MSKFILAVALLLPNVAFADKAVEGNWRANLGSNVVIVMSIAEDGQWASKTLQNGKPVAAMSGSYTQTTESPSTGTLVFTPDTSGSTASSEHGAPKVETDRYELAKGVLTLTVEGSPPMVFHMMQPQPPKE
jgi:hypothetical protein